MDYCVVKWLVVLMVLSLLPATTASGQNNRAGSTGAAALPTLAEVKAAGALRSSFKQHAPRTTGPEGPQPRLAAFGKQVAPVLQQACVRCHGPETQEGEFRVDTLDPDLLHGGDVAWWLEVVDVLSNGEMPPKDELPLADEDRSQVIQWLSSELQVASQVRRSEQGHSSFRRMTRYEYNYTLQDLLGLPHDFAQDLPPETSSEDGFENSSEMLQITAMQLEYYRQLGRNALRKATVRGDRPKPIYYGIAMEEAAARMRALSGPAVEKANKKNVDPEKPPALDPIKSDIAHFMDRHTGEGVKAAWSYRGAKYAWESSMSRPEVPAISAHVAVIPANQSVIFDLGDALPDAGNLRVRVRAARTGEDERSFPTLRLFFGHQASNNSKAAERASDRDLAIHASPEHPQFYQWDVPLSEMVRNPFRGIRELGDIPNPAEYLMLENTSDVKADIQIDYLEITAPFYEQWPPESHSRIFIASPNAADEPAYAREVLTHFMPRAWRRGVSAWEVDRKLALFQSFRPGCADFREAMIEVLATVLSSPNFLYLVTSDMGSERANDLETLQAGSLPEASDSLSSYELATRLSMFLWCSTPDEELLELAERGKLDDPEVLIRQTQRMLSDARSQRFATHFVRGWLGMQLLDFLDVDQDVYPQFDPELKDAMQQEPIAFFQEVLQQNHSVMDFLHADYALANARLARHYGLPQVYGNHFQRVGLKAEDRRGGLLTQAGLLAMNSDGKDSHPLKRGIWTLESLLDDPPPAPPPAVPEIDLADPEIAKLTLKQRIENHRNSAACMSCHAKIDPWGIAFENYDAVGSWRDTIGDGPVDASSLLFNNQQLDGMDGLKRFLLANRQDQFARAMVHKLTTFALGRPLTFGDRAGVDEITVNLRSRQDRLAELVALIVTSELFRAK